jgi:hypothetical protein
MSTDFVRFLQLYPPEALPLLGLDGVSLHKKIVNAFGIVPPESLMDFSTQLGCGYFGDRELY